MRCANCFHAEADAVDGKCLHRTDRFDRASGVSIVAVCGCKNYEDEKPPVPVRAPRVARPEPEQPDDVKAETETPAAEPPPSRTTTTRGRMGA